MLITLSLAEGVLRWLKIPQLSYGDSLPLIYERDEELGYRFVPNAQGVYKRFFEWETTIKINSLGWRDYEYPLRKPPGVYRIAVIGDSFAANLEVPLEQTYSKILEKLLKKNVSANIEVLNFAIDGTGTDYHFKLLGEILSDYSPDMVVHSFFCNDFEDVQIGKFYRTIYRNQLIQYQTVEGLEWGKRKIDRMYYTRWGGIKHAILKRSFLVRLVMYPFGVRWPHFYIRTTYSHKVPKNPVRFFNKPEKFPRYGQAVEKTKTLIRQFKELGDNNEVQYLLMLLHDKSNIEFPDYTYKLLEETIKKNNIVCLNLYEKIRYEHHQRQLFWKYDNHLNSNGCQFVAENLYRFLLDNKLLPNSILTRT
jgi:hypothetical protein